MGKVGKIKKITTISVIVKEYQKQGKTVGLITGCFDVIHVGHIDFFREAKKHVDVLIVGIENDKNISIAKGNSRPIFCLKDRCKLLSEIQSVDLIFPIKVIFDFNSDSASNKLFEITKLVNPDFLIANLLSDKYWKEKKLRAKKIGIKLLKIKQKPKSSSAIIEKISKEL